MLEIVILIFMSYKTSYQPVYDYNQAEQVTETVEFGDCEQLPAQKTLGDG